MNEQQAKHTPGNWVVGDGRVNDLAGMHLAVGLEGDPWKPICLISVVEKVNATDEANARLIAAAPDLLNACRQAIYALKGREHDGFLRAAISKATGEAA
jgi:hypothetical protein